MSDFLDFSSAQALIFDIDRTLTNTQKVVTKYTRETVQRLQAETNLTLALCSGRSFVQARDAVQLLPPQNYHVLSGGGEIINGRGEIFWEQKLPSDLVRQIARQAVALGAEFEFEHQGKVYVDPQKYERQTHQWYLADENLEDWSTSLLCIQWINDEFRDYIQQFEQLEVKEMLSEVNGPYVDITLPGVNKGATLQRWSQLSGIDLQHCVGFGDGNNDLEFLSRVGWSVAMGNSSPQLKKQAQVVIGEADEDGLAYFLEANFLQ